MHTAWLDPFLGQVSSYNLVTFLFFCITVSISVNRDNNNAYLARFVMKEQMPDIKITAIITMDMRIYSQVYHFSLLPSRSILSGPH